MHEQFKSFDDLENELLNKLKKRGCSSVTITGYRYLCNSVISWLKSNGFDHYTKEGGNSFLQDYLNRHGKNQYYTNLRTVIYRLNDLVDNTWRDVHSDKGKHFILSDEFTTIIDRYYAQKSEMSLATAPLSLY